MSTTQWADHAIVMHQYGPLAVLIYADVPRPPLAPHEIRIKSIASAFNHADLEIRAGNWPMLEPQPLPYVPGV
jgi:NADPH:quinone reductase